MFDWLRNKLRKTSPQNSNFRGNDDDDDDELPEELENIEKNSENQVSNQQVNANNNAKKKKRKKKKKKKQKKKQKKKWEEKNGITDRQKLKPIIVLPACCSNGGNGGTAGNGINHPFLQAPMPNNFNPLHCLACCCNNSNAASQPFQPFYNHSQPHFQHPYANSFYNNCPTPYSFCFNNNALIEDDNITKLNEIQEVENAERQVKMTSVLGSLKQFVLKLSDCKQKLKNFEIENSGKRML